MATKQATPRYYPEGLPRTHPLVRLYDIVYGLQGQVTTVIKASGNNVTQVSIVSGGGGGGGGGGNSSGGDLVDVFYLSSNNNITVTLPASSPAGYVAVLVQPANGNGSVIWGAGFLAAANSIDPSNNSISVFRFVPATVRGVSGYIQAGQPTTGMSL